MQYVVVRWSCHMFKEPPGSLMRYKLYPKPITIQNIQPALVGKPNWFCSTEGFRRTKHLSEPQKRASKYWNFYFKCNNWRKKTLFLIVNMLVKSAIKIVFVYFFLISNFPKFTMRKLINFERHDSTWKPTILTVERSRWHFFKLVYSLTFK